MSIVQVDQDAMCGISFYAEDDLLHNHSIQQLEGYYEQLYNAHTQYTAELYRLREQLGVNKRCQPDHVKIVHPCALNKFAKAKAVKWYSVLIKHYFGMLEEILALRQLYDERYGQNNYHMADLLIQLRKMCSVVYFEVDDIIGKRWDNVSKSYEYKVKFKGFESSDNDWVPNYRMDELRKTHPDFVNKFDRENPGKKKKGKGGLIRKHK